MKIIFADENINLIQDSLENSCDLRIYSGRQLKNLDLLNSGTEFLLTRSQTKINEELLKGTNVKFVATATSGTDHFDIDYLKSQKISYHDAKGSNANSVAEYVIFGILHWSFINKINLSGKNIGIIGYGCIGKLVAKYAQRIGLNVLINDPPLKDLSFAFPDNFQYMELKELISNSDIITNHVPLNKSGKYKTSYLFDCSEIDLIKNNSLFIHASRGGVVNENSLLQQLVDRNITAIIDVWENEPDFNIPLAEKSLITTPHVAGYSYDGKLRGTKMVLDSLESESEIISNRNLLNSELSQYNPLEESEYSNLDELYMKLNISRDIVGDTNNFKLINCKNTIQKITDFDRLRKNYPLRREIL